MRATPRNMVVRPVKQSLQLLAEPGLVTLVYVYPAHGYWAQAQQFVDCYHKYPPGVRHNTVVIVQSLREVPYVLQRLFKDVLNVRYYKHDNEGWDIGGYKALAKVLPESTPLFLCSSHAHMRRSGWLRRMKEVWDEHGLGVYGTLATYEVRPHFCTTGFMVSVGMLREHKLPVRTKEERYGFEHGDKWFVGQMQAKGYPVRLVTWDGVWEMHEWRKPDNIYTRGDHSNCVTLFNHSDSYERSDEAEKARRRGLADTLTVPMTYESRWSEYTI